MKIFFLFFFVSIWDDGCSLHYCSHHFMTYVSQIIILYTLTLHSPVSQLYLSKTRRKKKKKETKYSSPAEPKNKVWYVHTMEYYSASKRNEILIYTTIWKNLKIMISEKNPDESSPKKKFFFFLLFLYEMVKVIKTCHGNHFTVYGNQTIMLYTLNIQWHTSIISQ